MEAIGRATDEDPEEKLEVATDAAKRSIIGKEQAVKQVERDLERIREDCILRVRAKAGDGPVRHNSGGAPSHLLCGQARSEC